jgi:hypothetical protein
MEEGKVVKSGHLTGFRVRLGHRSPLPGGELLVRPPGEFDVVVGAIAFEGSAVVGLERLEVITFH